MKLPNPLSPSAMSALERRRALCAILARGVLRLAQSSELSADAGESSLHIPTGQSGDATPTNGELHE